MRKPEKRHEVIIELHSDSMSPKIQCLMFADKDGGYRLTDSKGCGSWNLVKKFNCSFTLSDLRQYEIKNLKK